MSESLVSIIIPVYNAKKYLAECLDSALNQSWTFKEIIVVDDGSSDSSTSIVEGYQNVDLKLIKQKNLGASSARNTGLKFAQGKYIQFLDADDFLSRDKIKHQVELLDDNEDHLALCPTVHFEDGSGNYSIPTEHEWYQDGSEDPVDFLIKLYGGGLIGPGYGGAIQPNAWLTPRKIIDKAGCWNESLSLDDDGEFFCRVVLNSSGVKYSPQSTNYYRKFKNGKNLSSQQAYKHHLSAFNSNILKSEYLLSRTDNHKAKLALSSHFWENVFNFYPEHPDLVHLAEQKAREIYPEYTFEPYTSGKKKLLANILGWKLVRIIEKKLQK